MTLIEAAKNIEKFTQNSLRGQIAYLENALESKDKVAAQALDENLNINTDLLNSALLMKQVAGQINEVVHAVGILLLLPHILREGEKIETLSLAAGNTGKDFDLETNLRIAEFKFIHWKGGSEVIRQNSIFKDFYLLAEANTTKERYLYVVGDQHPLKFFNSRRKLKGVMRDNRLWTKFQSVHGERFSVVSEYYNYRKDGVQIVDVAKFIPDFTNTLFSSTI